MNKIALFKWTWNPMSLLISLVTRCPITHAAIYDAKTGLWWHASETEGKLMATSATG